MKNVAIYARYSTDQQRDTSLEDQIARIAGYRRWEDLSRALSDPHVTRYIDMEDDRVGFVQMLAQRAVAHVDERASVEHIAAAFNSVGLGCSPPAHADAMRVYRRMLEAGGKAAQDATVMWVEETFSRGVRYGVENPEGLEFLRCSSRDLV